MTDENLFLKAIHHPDPEERNEAFTKWLQNEIDSQYEQLEEFDMNDLSRDEALEWTRIKSRMDTLSLVSTIAYQRRFVHYSKELEADDD